MPGLHRTSGRWRLGIYLTLVAVFMWGLLPIALSRLLQQMDPLTITWYRFVGAAVVLAIPVLRSRGLAPLAGAGRSVLGLLAATCVCLTANYVLYVLCLRYVTPSTAQVVIQLAPMCMLLGGLVIFRERFVSIQWIGLGLLVVGLLMFFDDDLPALMSGDRTLVVGLVLLVGAAVMWGCYALAQKQLLRTLSSPSIMVVIYVAASAMLLPFSSPAKATSLDGVGLALLAFLAVNTLAAYGAFAEALEHLEASRVSVVISLTPIVTIAAVTGGSRLLPSVITHESLSLVSLAGAGLVVVGSMLGALGRDRAGKQRMN